MKHGPFDNMVRPQPTPAQQGGGAQSAVAADEVIRIGTAVNSTLSDRTGAVQFSVAGIAGLDFEIGGDPTIPLDNDAAAEATDDAEQYSAPGIIGRPLPPRVIEGVEQHMDVMCVLTADGLVPFSYRDLRLKMGGAGPAAGVLAFVGYGGGFHSMNPVAVGVDPAGGGTIHVIYCPYDFDADGVAQKAHSIILDPSTGNESIIIAHADGQAMMMINGELTLKSPDGTAFMSNKNGKIDFVAETVTFNAGVVIGESVTAVPMLAGAASPPASKLFVSP